MKDYGAVQKTSDNGQSIPTPGAGLANLYIDQHGSIGYKGSDGVNKLPSGAKQYTVTMTQAAAGNPAVNSTVKNDLSAAIAWARTGAGTYTGTLAGAFLAGKFPKQVIPLGGDGSNAEVVRTSDDVITMTTKDDFGGANADSLLTASLISLVVLS